MKISKQLHDEAATVLACAASNRIPFSRDEAASALGVTFEAAALAWEAWSAVYDTGRVIDLRLQYAEAEALLRTGWTP